MAVVQGIIAGWLRSGLLLRSKKAMQKRLKDDHNIEIKMCQLTKILKEGLKLRYKRIQATSW